MKPRADHTRSSGNVLTDLELPDADERMLKAELAVQICRFIEEKGWTQTEAAEAVGLDQLKVSYLLRGRLAGFSVDRLLSILNRLGHSVEVRISAEEYDPEEAQTLVTVS
ncbi:MAG TPA: helix-turn-helix transcriptional regulator [Nitrososphaera sp.]|nr:helix-turn-helix transcriptional regulator [Nitrososphaera sp.]